MSTLVANVQRNSVACQVDTLNAQRIRTRFHSCQGRIGCRTYAWRSVVSLLLLMSGMGGAAVAVMVISSTPRPGLGVLASAFGFVALIAYGSFLSIVATVQRLHDIDRSGWHCLFLIVPIAGVLYWLYLSFKPADPGENRFGPPSDTTTFEKYAGVCGLLVIAVLVASVLIERLAPAF